MIGAQKKNMERINFSTRIKFICSAKTKALNIYFTKSLDIHKIAAGLYINSK
jgi:hypothetical protein